jgi:regulatory protein
MGDEQLDHALGLAYRCLNRRECTALEVRSHLERRGIDERLATEAVATLIEQDCIDDSRFARLFTQDKRELEQWGAERIRRDLRTRGVDRELIEATLAAFADETELERALALLRRRFPSPPRERRDRDRALGVLIRKGYDPELALDALAAYASARP